LDRLTDPVAHGGKDSDAFHVIVPSLPGFGFSDKPQTIGWTLTRTAKAWSELMKRLGYNRYVAQGGDLGAGVATHMGRLKPEGLAAIHLNFPLVFPPPIEGEPDATEKAVLGQMMRYRDKASAYAQLQKTRPQTLGYGLTDSPVGQAAWIYEKFLELTGDGITGFAEHAQHLEHGAPRGRRRVEPLLMQEQIDALRMQVRKESQEVRSDLPSRSTDHRQHYQRNSLVKATPTS
jgi:pimeloyl-ACP methyl ester carboxylesterase